MAALAVLLKVVPEWIQLLIGLKDLVGACRQPALGSRASMLQYSSVLLLGASAVKVHRDEQGTSLASSRQLNLLSHAVPSVSYGWKVVWSLDFVFLRRQRHY